MTTIPTRVDVAPDVVRDILVSHLQVCLGLTEARCYPVARAEDVPSLPPGGDYFLTVAAGDSHFQPGEQVPGNITEESSVMVSIYTRIRTDQTGHDRRLLMDAERGLYPLRNRVMVYLVGQDPITTTGHTFLRQLLVVESATRPELLESDRKGTLLGVMRLNLLVSYDVDLTAALPDGWDSTTTPAPATTTPAPTTTTARPGG